MKTLVLGGTGFVGRRLVEVLTADGAGVTVLNRGVTPVELPAGVARLVADRSDATSMRAALARTEWDAVFDVSGVAKVAGGTDPALAGLRPAGRPRPDPRVVPPVRRGRAGPGAVGPAVGPQVRPRLRGRDRRAGQSPLSRSR